MANAPKRGDIWDLKRTCYLVLEGGETGWTLQHTHLSQIVSGDLFTLEAAHPFDPLHGLVTAERVYSARGDAYKEGGFWRVPCVPAWEVSE